MEEKKKIKQKQIILMFIGVAILIVSITGITFAFFNYTKTGAANVIKTGNIEFSMTQGKTISLQNVFPITSEEALADTSNTSVCEIVITGRNTYAGGVEYLVSTVNATNTDVPVSILVNVEANGNGANDNLGTSDNNYFANRNSYTTSHYKKLVGDSFNGNEDILVGYIASSASTDNSINGKITIRAYFDKNNIIITDTPDETNIGDKTVMSTSEWNVLNSSGVSFQVRVEANEGKWVENPYTLYNIMKKESLGVDIEQGVDFSKTAEYDGLNGEGTKGVYTFASTKDDEYPVYYYRGAVENNNVLFNNICWKVVRTTDTGGVKLIYNGIYNSNTNSKCNNSSYYSIIKENENMVLEYFSFSGDYSNYPSYMGYMRGEEIYEVKTGNKSGSYWSDVHYNGNVYELKNGGTTNSLNKAHHYICEDSNNCDMVRYYFSRNGNNYNYVELRNGRTVNDLISEMYDNNVNSTAKDKIDAWYESNMTGVADKLEDTIWCNDRSFVEGEIGGFDSNNGYLDNRIRYGPFLRSNLVENQYNDAKNSPSLYCVNKNDRFTVNNPNGNQKLDYPIALLTADEIVLAGSLEGAAGNKSFYLYSGGISFWTMSPSYFDGFSGIFGLVSSDGYFSYQLSTNKSGIRPAVSLKPKTPVLRGTGTVTDPYVIG